MVDQSSIFEEGIVERRSCEGGDRTKKNVGGEASKLRSRGEILLSLPSGPSRESFSPFVRDEHRN